MLNFMPYVKYGLHLFFYKFTENVEIKKDR